MLDRYEEEEMKCQINNCANQTNMKINRFKIGVSTMYKIWVCEECYKKGE